jgi:hypothetical protein
MMMIKQIFLLIVIFLFTSSSSFAYFDISTPVEGNSIANDTLQFQVIKSIYENLSKHNSTCSDFKIKTTQVLHEPYDVKKKNNKYVKGYWNELWSVDVCGVTKQLPVTFYIKNQTTTFKVVGLD